MHLSTNSMTIGTLAKTCDVSAPTIRYYEKIALLPLANRNASDQRRYTASDVERLTFIRRCRDFGFSIEQSRDLVALSNSTTRGCSHSRDLAAERVTEIRAKVSELKALEKSLKSRVQKCETTCIDGTGNDCASFRDMRMPA
jgi:MerR family copper efflux transcriptional regulator